MIQSTERRNRTNGAAVEYYKGLEIDQQYNQMAEVLLAAILQEPYNFSAMSHKMHPVWWLDTDYAKVAEAIYTQAASEARAYSVRSVSVASGMPVAKIYQLIERHQGTGMELALSVFEPVYRQWIEWKCAELAISGILNAREAEQIRQEQDRFRIDRHAYIAQRESGNPGFDKWLDAKLEGYEIDHLCKPAIYSIIRLRFKTGYEPGEFVIGAARPSMGKTHWLLGEIYGFAKSGARGIFISADMEKTKVLKRLLGQITGENPRGDWSLMTDEQKRVVRAAKVEIEALPLLIIDDVVDVREIVAICMGEHYRNGLDFLAIDYVQQLTASRATGKGWASRNEEMSEISRILKHLSKVLKIPVLALSQLSRAVETRGGSKRPQLSDLRESGALEQDATTVLFFYRPEYYGIEEFADGTSTKGKGEIIFAKQQEDETGVIAVGFDGVRGWYDTFEDELFPDAEADPLKNTFTITPNRMNDEDIPF